MQLKQLSKEDQTRVLWLHHAAFAHSACETCAGACCSHCGRHDGYLSEPNCTKHEEIHRLKKQFGFDNERGFQTDTGCALPLTERSEVCLQFMCCNPLPPHVEPMDGQQLWSKEQRACADGIYETFARGRVMGA